MLPEGWERVTVGEACAIKNNLRLPLNVEQRAELKGPYPYFGPTGVLDYIDHYRIDEEFAVIGEDGDHFLKYRDKPMTLHFSGKANVNNHAHVVGASKHCSPKWFHYWFMHRDLTPALSRQGVGRYKLTKKALCDLEIWLPPQDEQLRISCILSTWDDAIAATERLRANCRRQKHSLLSILLGMPASDPAAQDRSGAYPPSVQPGTPSLPPTPAGWTRTSLGKHLIEVRRPAPLESSERYRLVTVKRSRGGVVLREELAGQDIKTPTQFYVRAGDFLISKRQIVHGACGIVPAELDDAIVSNEYAVLNSDGQIDLRFLRYLSESRYFQQTCFHSSIGVHVEKMIFKTERWLKWPFNIPPIPVQHKIIEVLNAARREVALFEAQVDKLKQEKAALMAQLLTGKRRVRMPAAGAAP